MKKIYIFLTLALTVIVGINSMKAHIVVIQSSGSAPGPQNFTPNVATANCGDTIKWVNLSGTHTTASTGIPTGAIAWSSGNIPAAPNSFSYVVTVPGTYNYTCHPATGGHMDASIVVTCTAGIASADSKPAVNAYPNPFSSSIIFEGANADMVTLFNCLGEKIKSSSFKNGQTILEMDAADLPKGIYFYSIYKDGVMIETKKLVKN